MHLGLDEQFDNTSNKTNPDVTMNTIDYILFICFLETFHCYGMQTYIFFADMLIFVDSSFQKKKSFSSIIYRMKAHKRHCRKSYVKKNSGNLAEKYICCFFFTQHGICNLFNWLLTKWFTFWLWHSLIWCALLSFTFTFYHIS